MKALLILVALLAFACGRCFAAENPNVLLIIADGFRESGGVFTGALVKTPHLDRRAARSPQRFGKSLCTARWRFTQWSDGASELYDHDANPEETHDLSQNTEQRTLIVELKGYLLSPPPWPLTP